MELQLADQLTRLEEKLDLVILYLQWAHPGLLQQIQDIHAQTREVERERGYR